MKFLIKHHQMKEQPYLDALLAAGHVQAKDADVCLIDFELPHEPYFPFIQYTKKIGAALVAYPHGLGLVSADHLIREPLDCAATFVHGPGQKHLRELYGYPNPIHWVGYPGPRVPLEPRECNRVLFAPHHPAGSGWMPNETRQANTEAFRTLLEGNFMLSVRVIGSLEQNGIWEEPGVRYIFAQMDGSVTEDVDVAVCGGTYLANSLCHGIPCVTYNQEREWCIGIEGEQRPTWVPDWRDHEDYARYPYDLSQVDVIEAAADEYDQGRREREEWMDRFMPPFDGEKFAKLVEEAAFSRVS